MQVGRVDEAVDAARATRIARLTGLTPGAFYATDLHSGSCLAQGASALSFPDLYADERGVAKLVTTVRTAPAANFVAGRLLRRRARRRCHHGGHLLRRSQRQAAEGGKSAAVTFLKGAGTERGRAELFQKGSDVTVWITSAA